jgi:hypothetical protein
MQINDTAILSEAQQHEILERDRLYEAGETESFTLEEIINYFSIKENSTSNKNP